MAKILIMTDTHQGSRIGSGVFRNHFREYYRDVLFPFIKNNDIDEVLHLGDFFDNRSALSLADIDYIMNEYIPLIEDAGVNFTIIAGNHDTHYRTTNRINSLAIFNQCKRVTVVDDDVMLIPTDGGKTFVMCPWINNENYDSIMETLSRYANDDHILCGHFEIAGCLMYKNSIPCRGGLDPEIFKGYHKVLSGHFHHPSRYGNIEYIGALFKYTWEDYGDWRGYLVYDTETNTFDRFENKHSLFEFVDYDKEDIESISPKDYKDRFTDKYVKVKVVNEYDRITFKEFIREIEKSGAIQVDVIDETIFDVTSAITEAKVQDTSIIKEPIEYAKMLTDREDDLEVFSVLYNRVLAERKED